MCPIETKLLSVSKYHYLHIVA